MTPLTVVSIASIEMGRRSASLPWRIVKNDAWRILDDFFTAPKKELEAPKEHTGFIPEKVEEYNNFWEAKDVDDDFVAISVTEA